MRHRYHTLLPFALLCGLARAGEVTLLSGWQGGGALQHIDSDSTLSIAQAPVNGVILGTPLNDEQVLELFYSRQLSRLQASEVAVPQAELIGLDIHYLHLGGTAVTEEYGGWQGFVSGGLGLTHFSPALSGAEAETRPSMSLGLGASWMATRHVGLRLEARLFGSLFNSHTRIFCSGGCDFQVEGDMLSQYALFAGVVLRLD